VCAALLRAGSFAFGDADYAQNVQEDGHAGEWQQSLWVLTQVSATGWDKGGVAVWEEKGVCLHPACASRQHPHRLVETPKGGLLLLWS
jgi:hypothetical protein